MKKLLILLFIFFLPFQSWATTYYMDYENGSNGNTGTSPEQAWKNLWKPNGFTFSAGDSVLFKRGQIHREGYWQEDVDGTSNSPFTVGAYGTGDDPKIYGSLSADNAPQSFTWSDLGSNKWGTATTDITEDPNMVFYNTVGGDPDETPYMTEEDNETNLDTNWEWFYDDANDRIIVYHDGGAPDTQTNGIEIPMYDIGAVAAQFVFSGDYNVIENLEFWYQKNNAIWYWGGTEPIINDCKFYHIFYHSVQSAATTTYIQDNYFRHSGYRSIVGTAARAAEVVLLTGDNSYFLRNELQKYHEIGLLITNCTGTTAMYNKICNQEERADFPWSAGIYCHAAHDSIIAYNYVDTASVGYSVNCEFETMSSNNNVLMYNIADDCWISFSIGCNLDNNTFVTNTHVYNNTFYTSRYKDGSHPCVNVRYNTGLTFKNNIIVNDDGEASIMMRWYDSTTVNQTFDYNSWYKDAGGWAEIFNLDSKYCGWFEIFQGEGHEANGSKANPKLYDVDGDCFFLHHSSPCIDSGVNLGTPYDGSLGWNSNWTDFVITMVQDIAGWNKGAFGDPPRRVLGSDFKENLEKGITPKRPLKWNMN